MSEFHYRTCNLCEAVCGIEIEHADGKVLAIRGDKQDPFSRGHICPKALALKEIYEDENRLKLPVKRIGNDWKEISWDEAFDEIANKIKEIQTKYGRNAVAVYQGNPSVHNFGTLLNSGSLLKALKTQNNFSATSVDQLPHHFAGWAMFGHPLLLPIPDIDRTNYFLIFGANPLASNGSLMTAPDIINRLEAIKKRGGKIVLIDPRRNETARVATEHHFIKPASDVYFLLAIIHTLFAENLVKLGHLADFTDGVDVLREVSKDYTPETVENLTGISAAEIKRITLEFANAKSAVCYGRIGVSTQKFGGLCHWLINSINIAGLPFRAAFISTFPHPCFTLSFGRSAAFTSAPDLMRSRRISNRSFVRSLTVSKSAEYPRSFAALALAPAASSNLTPSNQPNEDAMIRDVFVNSFLCSMSAPRFKIVFVEFAACHITAIVSGGFFPFPTTLLAEFPASIQSLTTSASSCSIAS